MSNEISRVTVIGAGTMGHGIAQVCAQSGAEVILFDIAEASLETATAGIDGSLAKLVSKERLTQADSDAARARISTSTEMAKAVAKAELIVEAVPENMDLKLELFADFDRNAPKDALLASNTSSLSITEIAAATSNPERVIGLHFFNPVPLMKLVEIVRGMRTDDATIEGAKNFCEQIKKEAIVVADWPGFATSRLGIILACEAIRMVEQGVASPADIDKAMELGYRHPMGPLKLTDLVGLDVRLAIMEHLFAEVGEQFRPPALMRQMVRAGKLGRKSGSGFYDYE